MMKSIRMITVAIIAMYAGSAFGQTGISPFGYPIAPDTASVDSHSVGSPTGSLSTSETGGAVYSVAIDVPQGLPQATPQINLSYNSQAGNGIAGFGCNIGGLSVITRNARSIYYDDVAKGIDYSADDAFYLDGQRMILLDRPEGADTALYCLETDPFTKITLHGATGVNGSTLWFSLRSKDGKYCEYGTSKKAVHAAYSNCQYADAWYLCKTTYPNGNYISYVYTKDLLYVYPYYIQYGKNANKKNGLVNRIFFSYESRPDSVRFRVHGQQGWMRKRLKNIEARTNGFLYRKYSLAYDDYTDGTQTKFSRLTTITESDSCGNELRPIALTWNYLNEFYPRTETNNININQSENSRVTTMKSGTSALIAADINNDGISDYIHKVDIEYRPGDGFMHENAMLYTYTSAIEDDGEISYYTNYNYSLLPGNIDMWGYWTDGPLTCDFNGDGYNDIIIPRIGAGLNYFIEFYFHDRDYNSGYNTLSHLSYHSRNQSNVPLYTCADLDKNGKSDLIVLETGLYNDRYSMCIFKGGSDFEHPDSIHTCITLPSKPKKFFFNDYNIDGLTDLMVVYQDGYSIFWNRNGEITDSIFQEGTDYSDTCIGRAYRMYEGDFNGDGVTDYLVTHEGSPAWCFKFGKGNGTFKYGNACVLQKVYKKTSSNEDNGAAFTCLVYDMDGDGKSDVFISKAEYDDYNHYLRTHTYWLTSDGESLVQRKYLSSTSKANAERRFYMVGDYNGDGLAELANYGYDCYNGGGRDSQLRTYPHRDFLPSSGKVTSITSSYGKKDAISYASLTNPSIYQRGTGAQYPIADAAFPLHVVSRIEECKGSVYSHPTNYYYGGLKYNLTGKGLLGFANLAKKDSLTGIDDYKQVWLDANTYMPQGTQNQLELDRLTATTETSFGCYQPYSGKKAYFAYPVNSEKIDLDGNQTTEEWTYDLTKNGSLTEHTSSHADGYEKEKFQAYAIHGGRYLPATVIKERKYTGKTAFSDQTNYQYDAKGQIVFQTVHTGKQNETSTVFTYDAFGNQLSSTTSATGVENITKEYQYDSQHRLVISQKEQGNIETSFTYDVLGNLASSTDRTRPSNPLITTYTHDGFGHILTETQPTGLTTVYKYGWTDANHYFILKQGVGQPWEKTTYDMLGQKTKTQVISPLGRVITDTYYYNQRKLLYRHTCGYSSESYAYDERGRVTKKQALGMAPIYYDYDGNTVTTTQGDHSEERQYDRWGNIVKLTDEAGEVSYQYNSFGKPLSVTMDGKTVSMTYDAQGRQTAISDPDAGTNTYTYDAYDRILTERNAQYYLTQNTYDAYGRLATTTTGNTTTSYTYGNSDADRGLLLSTDRDGCTISYTYDQLGRPTTESRTISNDSYITKTLSYDSLGQISGTAYSDGPTVSFTCDAYGFPDETRADTLLIHKPRTNTTLRKTDHYGRNLVMQWDFEPNGQVAELYLGGGNSSTACDILYSYNDLGSVVERRGMMPYDETFTYDGIDRLTDICYDDGSSHATRYAPNGNITYQSGIGHYFYEGSRPHAVTAVENTDNLIPHALQNTVWNAFGKISTITDESNDYRMDFLYGPDNERWKTTLKKDNNTVRTIRYLGDCEEITQNGVTRRLFYIGDCAMLVRQAGRPDSVFYFFKDSQGSIVTITDYDGSERFRAIYDAWGRQTIYRNDIGFHRGYTGHEMLPEFGLINMNGRLYDPLVCRFLSTDNFVQEPLNSQNFNRYSYCLNNPLKYTDPSGEIWWLPIAIGAAVGMYTGGVIANDGQYNPFKWDYNQKTFGYMLSGAIVGSASGFVGSALSTSGLPMANTLGIGASSLTNSIGTWGYTGGETPISVSLGIVSYDFTNGSFGYLGKKGNDLVHNLSYLSGGLANTSDIISAIYGRGQNIYVNSANTKDGEDWWGHSSITDKEGNTLVSVGPAHPVDTNNGLLNTWYNSIQDADITWNSYVGKSGTWTIELTNVSTNAINGYMEDVNRWDLLFNSCVGHTTRALWKAGVPTLYLLHPHMLNTQLLLRQFGIFSSPYLYQHNKY